MITFADPDLSFIEKEGQENDYSNRKHRTVPCFHLDGLECAGSVVISIKILSELVF